MVSSSCLDIPVSYLKWAVNLRFLFFSNSHYVLIHCLLELLPVCLVHTEQQCSASISEFL